MIREWKEIEPEEGRYRWDIIDSRLKAWADYGKTSTLRVLTAGIAQAPSPEWIYAKGVPRLDVPESQTVYPVFWNPRYLELYLRFVREMGRRFDGDPRLAFVQISVGVSGEVGLWIPERIPPGFSGVTTPSGASYRLMDKGRAMQRWRQLELTREGWIQTVKAIVTAYRSAFPRTQSALMISDFAEDANEIEEEAAFAVSQGAYLQYNGLTATVEELPSARPVLAALSKYASRTPIVFEAWGDTKIPRQGSLSGTVDAALRNNARFLAVYSTDLDRAQTDPTMRAALDEGARRFQLLDGAR